MGRTDLVELNEYSSEKIMYNLQPVNINFDLHEYLFNIYIYSNFNDDKFKILGRNSLRQSSNLL